MEIKREEKLRVMTQVADGRQVEIGTATIWRPMFEPTDMISSIDIQLDLIPIDGKIHLVPIIEKEKKDE